MTRQDAREGPITHGGEQTVELPTGPAAVWPKHVRIQDWVEPNVKIAVFDDTERYHPGLNTRALALESDRDLARPFPGYVGSTKIYHLERWNSAEAELIHRRAITLFQRALGTARAAVDLSWASVYRSGDYCLPHSHIRATASIVYFLELGLDDGASPSGAGEGRFCFADPRLKICCRQEPQAMTTPSGPTIQNGMMIMFPGKLVHMVDVFRGAGPRITLSWNINEDAMPGSPLPA